MLTVFRLAFFFLRHLPCQPHHAFLLHIHFIKILINKCQSSCCFPRLSIIRDFVIDRHMSIYTRLTEKIIYAHICVFRIIGAYLTMRKVDQNIWLIIYTYTAFTNNNYLNRIKNIKHTRKHTHPPDITDNIFISQKKSLWYIYVFHMELKPSELINEPAFRRDATVFDRWFTNNTIKSFDTTTTLFYQLLYIVLFPRWLY